MVKIVIFAPERTGDGSDAKLLKLEISTGELLQKDKKDDQVAWSP